jgi:hypothetical protein
MEDSEIINKKSGQENTVEPPIKKKEIRRENDSEIGGGSHSFFFSENFVLTLDTLRVLLQVGMSGGFIFFCIFFAWRF